MRLLSLLVVLLLASAGAPAPVRAQTWTTYTSEAGRFRVDMPGKPKVSSGTITSGAPQVQAIAQWVRAAYSVTYVDYPASILRLPPAKVLEMARDGVAARHTLIRDKVITIGFNPGREFVVVARADNAIHVARTTIVDRRVYLVMYTIPGQVEPTTPDVLRFLDSFELK
jgi:hypothetical protein